MKNNKKNIIFIIFFTVILVCLINLVVQNITGRSLFKLNKNGSDDVFMDYKYIIDYSPASEIESSFSDTYYIDFKNKEVTYEWSESWLENTVSGKDKKKIDDSVNIKLMNLLKEIDKDKKNNNNLYYIEIKINEENKTKFYYFDFGHKYFELFNELENIFK